MHANAEDIFLVQHEASENGNVYKDGSTPVPLGPAMETDISSLIRTVRIADMAVTTHSANQVFNERIHLADPGFMEMFSIRLKYGESKALYEKAAVILSEHAAKKYFGNENPVGHMLTMRLNGREEQLFTVRAVAKQFPSRTCVAFNILIPYENRFDNERLPNDWRAYTTATFIQLNNPEDVSRISSQMKKYVILQNAADTVGRPVDKFTFENLQDLKSKSGDVRNSIAGGLNLAPMIILASISLFLLLLSCFNFINISMAMAGARLKEIGIRKVMGSNKRQLIMQFLSENVMICLLASLMAIVIAQVLLIPAFKTIAGAEVLLDFTSRMNLWIYLLILLGFISVISGIYPALYIASFQPITVLRGRLEFSSKSSFMQFLLAFQFVLTFITMITSVGLTLNAIDMQNLDWGYGKENILVVQVKNREQYNLVYKTASEQSSVLSLTGARQHVGKYNDKTNVKMDDLQTDAIIFEVGEKYMETMDFELKEGKFPDSRDAIVVNETLFRQLNVQTRVGLAITADTMTYSIVGVVEDFHHDHFQRDIDPVVFRLGDDSDFTHVVMRTASGTATNTGVILNEKWKRFFPDIPFDHFFQDQAFEAMYRDTKSILEIFIFTTVLALLMSSVGLFGLASQRALRMTKELCIRKIFGISISKAIFLVNGKFLLVLAVAAVIATPASYFILNILLDSIYKYRMPVSVISFFTSYLLVFITMLIVLLRKIYEIVVTNPADILRNE